MVEGDVMIAGYIATVDTNMLALPVASPTEESPSGKRTAPPPIVSVSSFVWNCVWYPVLLMHGYYI